MTQYLHFTIGPVRSFVAEARRTRDFWAGSFLLSWLSAVAILKVEEQQGKVVFPIPDEQYLAWMQGKGTGQPPQQGGIPNRFKAEFDSHADAQVIGKAIEKAVRDAWKNLADKVYDKDSVKQAKPAPKLSWETIGQETLAGTRDIWNRQVENFWDIAWVVTDDADDSGALDRRKHWRSYLPPDEPGVKCMMMDGWQELSGLPEPGKPTPRKAELDAFWSPIRKRMLTDLRDSEMLCAVAFIKRRFVWHFHKLPMGWKLPKNVPSVAFMAGVHWLENTLKAANTDNAIRQAWVDYVDAADVLKGGKDQRPTWNIRIRCLDELDHVLHEWITLDGNLFHRAALENPNIFPDQAQARKVVQALVALNKLTGIGEASPFYAVLRMDGDNMGKLLRNIREQGGDEAQVSHALEDFTAAVAGIVTENNGFLIYAGGDDVLAILPLEDALVCAARLRERYQEAFAKKNLAGGSTLSGAICYAHIKTPLTRVLDDSHHLLDDIAKTATGRDAIAVRVLKPGGQTLQWAQPWKIAYQDGAVVVEQLAAQFQRADKEEPQFSNKFFYKIHEYFGALAFGESDVVDFEEQDVKDLLRMAFNNAGRNQTLNTLATDLPERLLEQCQPHRPEKQSVIPSADAAMLVRFLAQKGAE